MTVPALCLLLDDFSVVEGQVEEFGDILRVTLPTGQTRLLRRNQVIFTGGSLTDAYDFMTRKAQLGTAEGTLQLALWCEKVGLVSAARSHAARAAAQGHTAARDLLKRLDQASDRASSSRRTIRDAAVQPAAARTSTDTSPSATAARPADSLRSTGSSPTGSSPTGPLPAASASTMPVVRPVATLQPEASLAFVHRIQPVIVNLCANCHASSGYSGAFRFQRVTIGLSASEVASVNLAAVAELINREDPLSSPLLVYAVTAHGGQKQPALPNRDHPAYRNLEAWVITAAPLRPAAMGLRGRSQPRDTPVFGPDTAVAASGAESVASPSSLPGIVVSHPIGGWGRAANPAGNNAPDPAADVASRSTVAPPAEPSSLSAMPPAAAPAPSASTQPSSVPPSQIPAGSAANRPSSVHVTSSAQVTSPVQVTSPTQSPSSEQPSNGAPGSAHSAAEHGPVPRARLPRLLPPPNPVDPFDASRFNRGTTSNSTINR